MVGGTTVWWVREKCFQEGKEIYQVWLWMPYDFEKQLTRKYFLENHQWVPYCSRGQGQNNELKIYMIWPQITWYLQSSLQRYIKYLFIKNKLLACNFPSSKNTYRYTHTLLTPNHIFNTAPGLPNRLQQSNPLFCKQSHPTGKASSNSIYQDEGPQSLSHPQGFLSLAGDWLMTMLGTQFQARPRKVGWGASRKVLLL